MKPFSRMNALELLRAMWRPTWSQWTFTAVSVKIISRFPSSAVATNFIRRKFNFVQEIAIFTRKIDSRLYVSVIPDTSAVNSIHTTSHITSQFLKNVTETVLKNLNVMWPWGVFVGDVNHDDEFFPEFAGISWFFQLMWKDQKIIKICDVINENPNFFINDTFDIEKIAKESKLFREWKFLLPKHVFIFLYTFPFPRDGVSRQPATEVPVTI